MYLPIQEVQKSKTENKSTYFKLPCNETNLYLISTVWHLKKKKRQKSSESYLYVLCSNSR